MKFLTGDRMQKRAFDNLKEVLWSAPLLQSPDVSKLFLITTDASGYTVGRILSQGKIRRDELIAYTSWVLSGWGLKYDIYRKEALAVIHAVRTFWPYVFGRKFTIVTIASHWYGSKQQTWTLEFKSGDLSCLNTITKLYINKWKWMWTQMLCLETW